MFSVLRAILSPEMRFNRRVFAQSFLGAFLIYLFGIIVGGIAAGGIEALITMASGVELPEYLVASIAMSIVAILIAGWVTLFATGRLRDIGLSPAWFLPAIGSYLLLCAMGLEVIAAPDLVQLGLVCVVAGTIVALLALPGRNQPEPEVLKEPQEIADGLYRVVGGEVFKVE